MNAGDVVTIIYTCSIFDDFLFKMDVENQKVRDTTELL